MNRSSFPVKIECGSSTSQVLQMPPGSCMEASCEREYYLYIPTKVCSSISGISSDKSSNVIGPEDTTVGLLPLVFAVHCLGCTANAMVKFEEVAERFQFILVRPVGIARSWNAKYCCGKALKDNVDDVGFFNSIIDHLDANPSFDFIDRRLSYGVGWSNGGYMVTYAARLFRAIAPIAGYQYGDGDMNSDETDKITGDDLPSLAGHTATGIFQHHSINDQYVNFNGCCMAEGRTGSCCCGISEMSGGQCISVTEGWDDWATNVNHCIGSTTTYQVDDETTCYYGGSCQANTTLCVYDNKGHFNRPSFSRAFPMFDEIGHFFARDACSLRGGVWNIAEKNCKCQETSGVNTNTYCLSSDYLLENDPLQNNRSDFHQGEIGKEALLRTLSKIGAFMIFVSIAFWGYNVMIGKNNLNKRKKNDEFDRLANDSDTNGVELSFLHNDCDEQTIQSISRHNNDTF